MMIRPRNFLLSIILGAAFAVSACGTTGGREADVWPTMSALPASPPADLQEAASEVTGAAAPENDPVGPRLRAGSDGFVYVVGLGEDAKPGRAFVGRYAGAWPMSDAPRPALVAGRLVKEYGDGVGLVHLSYQVPDAAVDGLVLSWISTVPEEPASEETAPAESAPDESAEEDSAPTYSVGDEPIGKGMGYVAAVGEPGVEDLSSREVTLSIGKEDGVRNGDFYALLSLPSATSGKIAPRKLQLSRRLTGVCMVQELAVDSATCRLWTGSELFERLPRPEAGQQAIFLEHTFGAAPRQSVIQVAEVLNGSEATQAKIADAMRAFLASVTEPMSTVDTIEETLDATAVDFYRLSEEIEHLKMPQVVIGATVEPVDGEPHLFVNYSGVGPASGPGMVAAPPVGGVDLGPVDDINAERLRNFAATVWAGMLVYRGQTSEALLQLHQMLGDPALHGPLRWHARDQYAMRWGALDNYREALWLVLQDEAVAAKNNDRRARLNALGTRVRLYDFLDLPEKALSTAKIYLDARAEEKPAHAWRSAMGMYAEMLMSAGEVVEALGALEKLEAACPEGCNGELSAYIGGIFWRVPEERSEVRKDLLGLLVEHLDEENTAQVAALRLYQGLMAMRGEDFTQALIAFLEAERLYKKVNNLSGQARALYFAFMADLGRGEPQSAYRRAIESQKIHMRLNDFRATAELLERMGALYADPAFLEKPGPYLGGARQVLTGAVESSIAMGDLGSTGEALLTLGSFQLKIGLDVQAMQTLSQAAAFGVTAARFDIAALSHLYSAAIARQQGDMATFRSEIAQAQLMAALSEDPAIIKAVDDMLHPQQAPEIPTQLL
jgi:tetratricopeptide (TPR) repeat protein